MTAARPISALADEYRAALSEIHALDWTPDAVIPKGTRPIRYVTTAKIKRQVTPVLDKHGLRISMTMCDPPSIEGTVALVHYRMAVTNGADSTAEADIWAEGSNDPGKRILTSTTNAYRIYTLMTLAIIDGMEDEQPQDNPHSQAQAS